LTTEVKVDHEGHMYGSVSSLDIVHLIKEQTGIELEKRSVLLKHPIKQLGIFDIQLRLKEGVEALMHINILSDRTIQEPAA
ncbi:MAG: 50S ribosomal protein L9, partial [Verrucomicrobia bacterium]|nr:50S ribosomal protein L9 [Verrucomicrobiota bacterium]